MMATQVQLSDTDVRRKQSTRACPGKPVSQARLRLNHLVKKERKK